MTRAEYEAGIREWTQAAIADEKERGHEYQQRQQRRADRVGVPLGAWGPEIGNEEPGVFGPFTVEAAFSSIGRFIMIGSALTVTDARDIARFAFEDGARSVMVRHTEFVQHLEYHRSTEGDLVAQ